MELTDEEVGASLPVGGEVDVDQRVTVEVLVTAGVIGFEDREREAGKEVAVNLVGRKSCCSVGEVVAGRRHFRQQHLPVGLFFVANHREHLGEDVDLLDAAAGAEVISAGVDFADANAVVDDGHQVGGELLSIVGDECHRAPPKPDVFVE